MRTRVFHPGAPGRSNMGMHPTRIRSDVIVNWKVYAVACGRVMPGVRCFFMKPFSALSVVLLAMTVFSSFGGSQERRRRPSRYLIPEGYIGWVKLNFRVNEAPALPMEGDHYLFKFPSTGVLETSSDIEYGSALNHYFYYCGDTRRKLTLTTWDGGGMIWGGYTGWSGNNFAERTDVREGFFVGTEEQFKTLGADKDESHHPKVGPVDKSKLTCVNP